MENNGFGLFRTADGRVASLHSSWTQWKGYLYLELFGTDGFLTINYDPPETTLVRHVVRRATPSVTIPRCGPTPGCGSLRSW